MKTLTNKDIEERKKAGAKMNRLNCGWTLTPEQVAKITLCLNEWQPENETEKRDKLICYYAFVKNMNAAQICRLNNPLFVGMGNRSKGKPLSACSILAICYKYFPEAKQRACKGKGSKAKEQRNELYKQIQQGEIHKPKVCATCGTTKNIELHHIIPLEAGGTNDYFNLVYLCHTCHMKLHHIIYDKLKIPKSTNIE